MKTTTLEQKQRLFNFLIDDLIKLKKDIKENNKEEINIFFSYWKQWTYLFGCIYKER